ncbi:hypothetical protein K2173_011313 [Erythroxylum novogranatense]|uniref:Dirigent protein n=1 Tax=Erythroxylum novogranatense TaxID=1862640 RepID=A0AAV8S9N7_9ROSI|nr:hypothetical protein K2173_011313 [Erythroxylum novogranatense]
MSTLLQEKSVVDSFRGKKMVSSSTYSTLFVLSFTLSVVFPITGGVFYEELTEAISMKLVEKTTHLHFYFHDVVSGKDSTVVRIAGPPESSGTGFGDTMMTDDLLTEGPELGSKIIGRAQGMYGVSAQHELSLLMVMNYVFTEGKYNGSSVSILGRNHVLDDSREMPIVGGSGLFRLARGYALAHTVKLDMKTGDAVVEYNVYVSHY